MITPEIKLSAQTKVAYARISTLEVPADPSHQVYVEVYNFLYFLDTDVKATMYVRAPRNGYSDIIMNSGRIVRVSYCRTQATTGLSEVVGDPAKVWLQWAYRKATGDGFYHNQAIIFRFELIDGIAPAGADEVINIMLTAQIAKDIYDGNNWIWGPKQRLSAKLSYTQDEPMIFEWLT